jgi:ketosteroid isomerase-like protein
VTACELVREAVEALERGDAVRLLELVDRAAEVEVPETEAKLREFWALRRGLEKLLILTRRNLTILQGVCGELKPYCVQRG